MPTNFKVEETKDGLKVKATDKWWQIVLKVIAYVIGLILAGVGTADAASMLFR
jgi:hypothetical protein